MAFPLDRGGWCRNLPAALKHCTIPLLLITCSNAVQACPVANKTIQLTGNGHALTTEVATTRDSHMCGLAFRRELPANHGMLFAYAQDRIVGFWMKNTFIPLSIAFLDADGRILETHDMDPRYPARRYISRVPARYALEVNQGWFSKNGLEVGDSIEIDLQAVQEIYRFDNK